MIYINDYIFHKSDQVGDSKRFKFQKSAKSVEPWKITFYRQSKIFK